MASNFHPREFRGFSYFVRPQSQIRLLKELFKNVGFKALSINVNNPGEISDNSGVIDVHP